MSELPEIIDRWFELLDAGVLDEGVQLFTEDAEYRNDAVSLRGREEIRASSAEFNAAFPNMKHRVLVAIVGPEPIVAIEGRFTATFTGPLGDVAPTGRSVDMGMSAIVRFDGALMSSWHGYYDRLTLNEQLGLA